MSQNSSQVENSHNEIKKQVLTEEPPTKNAHTQIPILESNHNGFTHRPTIHQIFPIIFAIFMTAEIILLAINLEKISWKIALCVSYAGIFCILTIFWYSTTRIDPTDGIQIAHKEAIKTQTPFNNEHFKYFCHTCQTCVSKDSFHCRKCNRCVQIFDHHCKWLNNCIGAKNYLQFVALIFTVQIMLIFHIVVNCVHVGHIVNHKLGIYWHFYIEVIFIGLDSIPFFMNSVLVFMHVYLLVNKRTTLSLILQRRKNNKIFPSQAQSEAVQKTEKPIVNLEQLAIPKQMKISRKKIERDQNTLKFSENKGYSFRAKSKSFKIKMNYVQK